MLTKDIRKTIDNARDVLVGKIPNPQSQIEQITIAMIYKFMDDMDIESVEFGGERQFFVEELSEYAWSKIMSQQLGNEARMNLYTEALDKLQLSDRIPKLFRDIFKGAYLPFRDGQTLTLFLKEINDLSYNNSENLGNGFEYLLSIMGSQGDAGQFRTPRHIIDFIVDIVKPTKADTILDPACGTAGFLISAYKYIQKTAEDLKQPLTPQERTALTENIQGYDISPDMVKLALVNMYLHKFKDPKIYEYDTLTQDTRWDNYFDCILANPPFMTPKGGIQPHNKFGVKANRSEVLFVDYIMEHLNSTGRAGVIVPEGIVFQSANAYKELRKKLVDENYLYAVASLPSGIFQPYSGVKTSILFMDRQLAKKTDKVLFVEIQNDGFDLGAQRRPIDKNDLPKALELINQWQNAINTKTDFSSDSQMITLVEKSKLAENEEYNLTASRYKVIQDFSNCKWEMVELTTQLQPITYTNKILKSDFLQKGKYPIIDQSENFIAGYWNNEQDLFRVNKPVVVFGDHTRIFKFIDFDFVIGADGIKILLPNEKWNSKFFFYLLNSLEIKNLGYSRHFKELKTKKIPLPPLEVQEEIVKELDSYQAVIDGAQKVVDNWKPTLPINPNWKNVKLERVCDKLFAGGDVPADNWQKEKSEIYNVPIYSNGIGDKALYGYTNIAKVSEDAVTISARGTIGYVEIRKAPYYPAIRLISAIPNKKVILLGYLKLILQNINILGNGNSIPQLTVPMIKDLNIYLPSIEEQKLIVKKIEEEKKAIEECKKLIELHKEKINTKIQSIWGDSCENNN